MIFSYAYSFGDYLFSSPEYPIIWIIPMAFFILFGILIYKNALNKENLIAIKRLLLGYSVFFICYGISMIFFFGNLYYSAIGLESSEAFITYTRIGYVLSLTSSGFLIYSIERFMLNTKGILSFPQGITVIITLVSNYETFSPIAYIIGLISFFEIIIIYVILSWKGKGIARIRAITAVIGLLIFDLGAIFASNMARNLTLSWNVPWLSYYFAPICYALSTIFLYNSFIRSIDLDQTKGISNVWIIERDSGLCVYEHNFMKLPTNTDLISGFLMANLNFGEDLTKKQIKRIIFDGMGIYFHHKDKFIVTMAITDDASLSDSERLLIQLAEEFDALYHEIIGKTYGNFEIFKNFDKIVDNLAKKKAISFDLLIQTQVLKNRTESKIE